MLSVNLIVKPFWILGIDRTVQNMTGSAEYGFYFAMLNFSLLFNILLDLGITNFNNRNISQNEHLLQKHFAGISILKFLLSLIYLSATFITAYFFGYDSRQFHFLLFLSINQFLLSFILYLRSNISGLQLFKTDSILSVLDRLLMIILCSILLWSNFFIGKFTIEWFIYAQTISYFVTFIICLGIVMRKAKYTKLNWNVAFFYSILRQSAPFALLILLMTFYNRIDSVMLERLLPDGDHYAGVYAAAFRLLDAFNMFPYLFAVLLLPMFSRMLKNKELIQPIIKISFNLLFVVSTFVAIFSVFNSYQIIDLLYLANVEESSSVFKILMFCFIPVSITYIFGTLLTANGSLKQLNIIAGSGMLLNIILNFILIPEFKAVGSAYVSLATQTITALLQLWYCISFFRIAVNYKYLAKLAIHLVILILTVWILQSYDFNLIFKFTISGFIVVLSSFATGIIKPRKFLQLIFNKATE